MNLRRLNDEGLRRFAEYLLALKATPTLPPPVELLTDPDTSQEATTVTVTSLRFANRLEAGRWLFDLIERAGIDDPARDKGLWAWLSLFLFDQVCPPNGLGHRKPGELARHVPAISDYRKYYRHLLAGPWRMCRAHRDNPVRALAVLHKPLDSPGELSEQIMARQELVTNRTFMAAATKLYIDPTTGERRRGAASQTNGGARRLADYCNQIDLTWDLYALEAEELVGKLPHEFDRFRNVA